MRNNYLDSIKNYWKCWKNFSKSL